jgi:hypothetical protein
VLANDLRQAAQLGRVVRAAACHGAQHVERLAQHRASLKHRAHVRLVALGVDVIHRHLRAEAEQVVHLTHHQRLEAALVRKVALAGVYHDMASLQRVLRALQRERLRDVGTQAIDEPRHLITGAPFVG